MTVIKNKIIGILLACGCGDCVVLLGNHLLNEDQEIDKDAKECEEAQDPS